jgi:hypothetical protein
MNTRTLDPASVVGLKEWPYTGIAFDLTGAFAWVVGEQLHPRWLHSTRRCARSASVLPSEEVPLNWNPRFRQCKRWLAHLRTVKLPRIRKITT